MSADTLISNDVRKIQLGNSTYIFTGHDIIFKKNKQGCSECR